MIYTKEALEAARLKVTGNPTVEEQAYIDGWNDALEAVMNNLGVSRETTNGFFDGLAQLGMNSDEMEGLPVVPHIIRAVEVGRVMLGFRTSKMRQV